MRTLAPFPLLAISLALLLVIAVGSRTAAAPATLEGEAREFVAAHDLDGINQFKFLSPDIVEAFPPGRSNAANDERLKKYPPASTDWKIEDAHFIYEGDHYAVQWIFQSKWKDNGSIQREATLAFGVVKGGKLVSWTEFFDDSVGELQHDGKMGTYTEKEEAYPWPAKPGMSRPYRTYDSNSVTWKNYPDLSVKLTP